MKIIELITELQAYRLDADVKVVIDASEASVNATIVGVGHDGEHTVYITTSIEV